MIKESGAYLITASSIQHQGRHWDLREAAIAGNGIRLFKLLNGFLDHTCAHRQELSAIFCRLIFETAVSVKYLAEFGTEEVLRSYLRHSFRYERRLLDNIESNIRARDGAVLPIERRMMSSIDSMLHSVGFEKGDLLQIEREWGGKNLFQKCEVIGWDQIYLAMFAGMSGSVHGSWTDLQLHHLRTISPCEFEGVTEWSSPRPQAILALSRIIAQAAAEVFAIFQWEEMRERFLGRIEDLFSRVDQATQLHEEFLQRGQSQS